MKRIFAYLRFIPILFFFPVYKNNIRLRKDLDQWINTKNNKTFLGRLAVLLQSKKEFRNLFIHRNTYPKNHFLFRRWIKIWYPPEPTLYLECPDIGGGCYIQHGFATYVTAKKIGDNFHVNQQVTIGYSGPNALPTIKDNCMVMCGAKVLGDITLGNYTRVGANAVVIKDYKRGYGLLVGVPAKPKKEYPIEVLRKEGIAIEE